MSHHAPGTTPATSWEFPSLQVPGSPQFASAHGATCTDRDGTQYVDLAMGFGVRLFGHGATSPIADVTQQVATAASGLGDLYTHELREHAVRAVCEESAACWSGATADSLRASIWHTGSEAVETALKTALLATGRSQIVACTGAYHGTFGLAMAASWNPAFRTPFASQLSGSVQWTGWNEIPQVTEQVACVIVEPIQGRAGVIHPDPGFLAGLREACTQAGALLVLDEVLTGSCRSGAMLAGGHAAPDIVALGKALGGGVPASATIARADVAAAAWGGITGEAIHTSTWVGDPIACAGIIAAHERRAATRDLQAEESRRWEQTLRVIADQHGYDLRGQGLVWALDTGTADAGWSLAQRLLHDHHIIVVPSGYDGRSITLLPSIADGDMARDTLAAALNSSTA